MKRSIMISALLCAALTLPAWSAAAADGPTSASDQPAAAPEAAASPYAPGADPLAAECAADRILATTNAPKVYVVQRGDTLWGISERFFDTPWVWSKLWEQNSFITNPHRISPGLKLTLYPGLFSLPAPQPVVAQAAPEPVKAPEAPKPALFCPSVEDVGFLSFDKADATGHIFAAQDPLVLMVGRGDRVFIRLEDGAPAIGDRFRVMHISEDPVEHPLTGKPVGFKHTFPGVLQVVEVKDNVATAEICEAHAAMEVGDALVPWFPMPQSVELSRGGPQVDGRLLAAQEPRYIFGQGNLVFLDLGSDDGIAPGRVMGIWREEISPDGMPMDDMNATQLGEAVVLAVRPDTSTAYITYSRCDISAGAVVRPEQ